jgi:hypothetical protein
VAVCPRRSTDIVVLGATASDSIVSSECNAELTALALASGALLKMATAPENKFAEDGVEPSAIAALVTNAIDANNRKAPRLVRIVLMVECKSERKDVLGTVLITGLQNKG